ncbi:monooxygenase fad-binding protein [Leptolyngbya sp. Heron Island J]|uniref:FAD-dependent oxidoreductase n=1 Tax=Leptolyngbya sp. Heron Island J TaxID=1385935 RepID=UPI0003B9E1A6|nr:FAD-dependent monooxygenase [Leptolyngbya sp. Heron Island J]ESA33167.1 monooxygenase fad-binding protein [Leptolyngbya sp. Heron Island J]
MAQISSVDRHAIVIGGSIAGLLTARVLTDHFERVTILERDSLPMAAPAPRKGIPQCTQLHILLTRGRQIMEELFPGLEAELIDAGAAVLDMGTDVEWLNPFGWGVRFPSGFKALSFSRYILDWLIYRRLSQFDQIQVLESSYVTDLLTNAAQTAVTGVRMRQRDLDNPRQVQYKDLTAALVVDASGYSSQAPKWLQKIGYEPPEETVITTSMGYASRLYEIPAEFNENWRGVYIQAAPPERTSMGVIYPIENNRWIVGVCATAPQRPANNEADFLDALQNLPSPHIYDAVKAAKPATEIGIYHPPGNRLRHYERLSRQPQGFIAIGDSVCCFTPIYGQGMTVAALGAVLLQQCLSETALTELPSRFQSELAKVNAIPWIAATSQDAKYPSVKGLERPPTLMEKAIGWYMDRLIQLTTKEPQVTLLLFNVFHMVQSSDALFQPSMLLRVMQQLLMPSSAKTAPKTHSS